MWIGVIGVDGTFVWVGWGWGYFHVNLLYWYKGQVKPDMRRKGTVTKGTPKRNVACGTPKCEGTQVTPFGIYSSRRLHHSYLLLHTENRAWHTHVLPNVIFLRQKVNRQAVNFNQRKMIKKDTTGRNVRNPRVI